MRRSGCPVRDAMIRSALASRDIIGQAKGVVMERYNVNAVAAFNLLVKISQERNTPVDCQRHVKTDPGVATEF